MSARHQQRCGTILHSTRFLVHGTASCSVASCESLLRYESLICGVYESASLQGLHHVGHIVWALWLYCLLTSSASCGPRDITLCRLQEYLEKERKWCKNTVASMPAPVLAFERFIFTETGTLLMTWTDQSGQVEELRKKCKAKFPGSVHIKQSNILHTSMLRLLSTQPLDDYIREKIVETCDKWTEKLKGDLWETEKIWYVLESEFSTLAGTREDMPFKQ